METKERIRQFLSQLEPRILSDGFVRESAVLMPFFKRDGEYHVLLTRRTDEVQTHKGQISFPGGMREEGEDLERTALRETFEEVGLDEKRIDVLGRFHDYVSIHGYRVTPFAGFIDGPFTTRPQVREVAEILQVPFRIFLDPGNLRVEKHVQFPERGDVYFYTYGKNEIWGLTALILKDFFEALKLNA